MLRVCIIQSNDCISLIVIEIKNSHGPQLLCRSTYCIIIVLYTYLMACVFKSALSVHPALDYIH